MIARVWHGWTAPGNADPHESLLKKEIFAGIPARCSRASTPDLSATR